MFPAQSLHWEIIKFPDLWAYLKGTIGRIAGGFAKDYAFLDKVDFKDTAST